MRRRDKIVCAFVLVLAVTFAAFWFWPRNLELPEGWRVTKLEYQGYGDAEEETISPEQQRAVLDLLEAYRCTLTTHDDWWPMRGNDYPLTLRLLSERGTDSYSLRIGSGGVCEKETRDGLGKYLELHSDPELDVQLEKLAKMILTSARPS